MNRLVPLGIFLCLSAGANAGDAIGDADRQFTAAPPALAMNQPATRHHSETLGTILFRSDSADIDQALWPVLQGAAARAHANPDLVIELEAYCDVRGSRNHNLTLSAQRAQSVAEYLVRHGISRSRIRTRAYGEQRASANVKDRDGHIFDRRVTITLHSRDVSA